MKYKVLCLALCVALLAVLIACTQQQIIEEPTPTEKMTPDATIKPTPTPQLNYAHDYEYEFVKCEINPEGAPDVKAVWKVAAAIRGRPKVLVLMASAPASRYSRWTACTPAGSVWFARSHSMPGAAL